MKNLTPEQVRKERGENIFLVMLEPAMQEYSIQILAFGSQIDEKDAVEEPQKMYIDHNETSFTHAFMKSIEKNVTLYGKALEEGRLIGEEISDYIGAYSNTAMFSCNSTEAMQWLRDYLSNPNAEPMCCCIVLPEDAFEKYNTEV